VEPLSNDEFVTFSKAHDSICLVPQSLWLSLFTISRMKPGHCCCGHIFVHKKVIKIQKSNGFIAKVWLGLHFVKSRRAECLASKDLEMNKAFIVVMEDSPVIRYNKHFFFDWGWWTQSDSPLDHSESSPECWRPPTTGSPEDELSPEPSPEPCWRPPTTGSPEDELSPEPSPEPEPSSEPSPEQKMNFL
jgi:hypothetical protein